MKIKSLIELIDALEELGELKRIQTEVSPVLEITEVADRLIKTDGPAILFENNGTAFPVLINAFGSNRRLEVVFNGMQPDEIAEEIESFLKLISQKHKGILSKLRLLPKIKEVASWMPGKNKGKAPCQEVVHLNPDLDILPVLKCWPYDGGRFITLPIVHTIDPDTGERNVGMYRMQVFDSTTTGMHWHMHKDSASHFRKYKNAKKKMPVAVVLGGDLIYTYAATAPLPENIDEYFFAGFLRKKKVRLANCLTQPIDVPTDADIVIEGYVDPNEELVIEGPFGDHTGFYSLEDYYPRFHVTCITHRKNAIYPATIVGIPPMEDAWIGKATERIFLAPIKLTVCPDIIDIHMPSSGVFHNLVLVKIKKLYPGHAFKVMNALWGAGQMMFSKVIIVVNEDVDIHNYKQIAKAIENNVIWSEHTQIIKGPADVLDHASRKFAYHGKIGIDATNEGTNSQNNKMFTIKNDVLKNVFDMHRFDEGMDIAIISATQDKCFKSLVEMLAENHESKLPHLIILIDKDAFDLDYYSISWLVMNNIDPLYDLEIIISSSSNESLFVDGRSKDAESENFNRRWPNILASTNDTIDKIDEIWATLNLGSLIESPSKKYNKLVKNEGAEKNK